MLNRNAIPLVGLLVLLQVTVAAAQERAYVAFKGIVVDSTKQPLENAEVSLPGLGMTKTTNDKGVFGIVDVPAGIHRIVVKHIGFGQLDTNMVFSDDQNLEWRVTLGRLVTLDSVVVTAPVDPLIVEFESNRARGFGRFLTRADLAKKEGQSLAGVLSGISGMAIMRGNGGASWVASKRGPRSSCAGANGRISMTPNRGQMTPQQQADAARAAREETEDCVRRERMFYVPDPGEQRMGMIIGCFAQVYLDRTLQNPGKPTTPFDLRALYVDQIEAIEWYESPSQTPPKYAAREGQCGVMVIHMKKKASR